MPFPFAVPPNSPAGMPSIPLPFAVGPDLVMGFGASRQPCGAPDEQHSRRVVEQALAANTGKRPWRATKENALRDVLAVTEQTSRVRVLAADIEGDLSLFLWLRAPAPCWPTNGQLGIATEAIVHLCYQELWLSEAPHGQAPAGIIQPFNFYAPNAAPAPRASLCLGVLPAGLPVSELLQLTYLALTLQTLTLDETEGVLNPHACDFYRDHPQFIPLTRTSLLEPWSPEELQFPDAVVLPQGGRL